MVNESHCQPNIHPILSMDIKIPQRTFGWWTSTSIFTFIQCSVCSENISCALFVSWFSVKHHVIFESGSLFWFSIAWSLRKNIDKILKYRTGLRSNRCGERGSSDSQAITHSLWHECYLNTMFLIFIYNISIQKVSKGGKESKVLEVSLNYS